WTLSSNPCGQRRESRPRRKEPRNPCRADKVPSVQVLRLMRYRSVPMPIEIRRKEVKTLVAQGRAQLVEVLPASAYKKEHLPEALNMPLETLTAATTKTLRKDQ